MEEQNAKATVEEVGALMDKNGIRFSKPVEAWKDGAPFKKFPSMSAASRETGAKVWEISRAVCGQREEAGGYTWKLLPSYLAAAEEKEKNAMSNDTNEQKQEIQKVKDWSAPGAYESELEWTLQQKIHNNLVVSTIRKVYWVPGTYEPPLLDYDVFIRIETLKDGKVVDRFHIASESSVYEVFKNINRVFSEECAIAKQGD